MRRGAVRVAYSGHWVETVEWSAHSEMEADLAKARESLTLGDEEGGWYFFRGVLLYDDDVLRAGIGIASSSSRTESPQLVFRDNGFLLAYNDRVVRIDFEPKLVVGTSHTIPPFRCLIEIPGGVLVYHDIGILRLENTGHEVWHYSADLIGSINVQSDRVALHLFEGGTKTISLGTGCEI